MAAASDPTLKHLLDAEPLNHSIPLAEGNQEVRRGDPSHAVSLDAKE